MVSGAQRLAYRIQGNACPTTALPYGIDNDYDNNEAHSSMAGAVMWPQDPGFQYDTSNAWQDYRNSILIEIILF